MTTESSRGDPGVQRPVDATAPSDQSPSHASCAGGLTPMSKFLLAVVAFILSAILLGGDWSFEDDWSFWGWIWKSFKEGIEHAWHIAVAIGGFYALLVLAVRRAKAADDHASAAMKQADMAMKQAGAAMKQAVISSRSNQAQRYEKAAEMLWHPKEVGIREAGCYALKSLGGYDIDMAMQCRDLLVSFIRRSSPTPKQKAEEQEQKAKEQEPQGQIRHRSGRSCLVLSVWGMAWQK